MIEKNQKQKTNEKNLGGRPTKLVNFIEAFKKVLNEDEFDIIILTDDELRISCNEFLEEEYQISDTTFENWKAGKLKDSLVYQEFLVLYKKALINQKKELFKKFKDDNQWQRYAWIIERKFNAWNLKQISEVDQKTEHSGNIGGILDDISNNKDNLK